MEVYEAVLPYLQRHLNGILSELFVGGVSVPAEDFTLDYADLNPELAPDERMARGTLAMYWGYGDAHETGVVKIAPVFDLPLKPAQAEVRYMYEHADGDYRLFGRLILPAFRITGWSHSVNFFKEKDKAADRVRLYWESEGWDFKRGDEA